MKSLLTFVTIFALFFGLTATASPIEGGPTSGSSTMTQAKWDAFSQNLVKALASDHVGLQQGALRMIIQYGDNVDVDAALFDVMRVYRDNEDDNMRRMAVVALGKMDNALAIGFLERSVRFEKSPCVKKTMLAVVSESKVS